MSRVSLSRRVALAIASLLEEAWGDAPLSRGKAAAIGELRAALAPKAKSFLRKKTEKRKRDNAKATRAIYGVVELRARGRCEVPSCSEEFSDLNRPEMDHFLPKGRRPQSDRTCWLIHWGCHRGKHASWPDRAFWLVQFINHCEKYGYDKEAEIARAELEASAILEAIPAVGCP